MIWFIAAISVILFCIWATLSTIAAQLKRIADAQERMAHWYTGATGDKDSPEHPQWEDTIQG